MPFGVVSGVGRRIGVLYRGGDRRREGEVLGVNMEHPRPIVINQWRLCGVGVATRLSKLLRDFSF